MVAAVFQPTRRRLQQAADRCFNRRRYDAAKLIEAFRVRLPDEVHLDSWTAELLALADQTMSRASCRFSCGHRLPLLVSRPRPCARQLRVWTMRGVARGVMLRGG